MPLFAQLFRRVAVAASTILTATAVMAEEPPPPVGPFGAPVTVPEPTPPTPVEPTNQPGANPITPASGFGRKTIGNRGTPNCPCPPYSQSPTTPGTMTPPG